MLSPEALVHFEDLFTKNEREKKLNTSTLQIAVLDAAHRAMPELGLEFFLSETAVAPYDDQRLGLTQVRLGNFRKSFHTLVRSRSQAHDMGVLLAQLGDRHGSYPPLLILPYMPQKQAFQCKKAGLNFLDAAGNMFLCIGDSVLFVTGMPRPGITETAPSFKALTTGTGMRVLFNLLVSPELLNAPYRDISKAANVSLGSVSNILDSLASHRFIDGKNKNRRRLVQPIELIDLWASNYPLALRGRLNARRFSSSLPGFPLESLPPASVWGGEVAAYRLLHYMEPQTYTIYSDSLLAVIQHCRLRADPQGPIEVLDAFWPANSLEDCAHPLLVYADLASSTDPRCMETASLIRSRYLEP